MLLGYSPLYPRGEGAASGPLPPGHVMVSRWVGETEARMWMASGATHVPPGLGAGGHLSVGEFGASRIPGTDPIRIDFSFPKAGLQKGGRTDWKFIIQVVANVPIYNVVIWVPVSVPASRITGKK
jgi:filamentous hemagglutinin